MASGNSLLSWFIYCILSLGMSFLLVFYLLLHEAFGISMPRLIIPFVALCAIQIGVTPFLKRARDHYLDSGEIGRIFVALGCFFGLVALGFYYFGYRLGYFSADFSTEGILLVVVSIPMLVYVAYVTVRKLL